MTLTKLHRAGLAGAALALLASGTALAAPVFALGETYYLSAIGFPNGSSGAVVTAAAVSGFAGGGLTRLTLNPGPVFDAATRFTIDALCIDPRTPVVAGPYTVIAPDNNGRGWELASYVPMSDWQKGAIGFLQREALRLLPDPAVLTPARERTSGALQMAVWTVLNPSASWSGDPALIAEFNMIMASIPVEASETRFPSFALALRSSEGLNIGQPWILAVDPTAVPAAPAIALVALGLALLPALRRARD